MRHSIPRAARSTSARPSRFSIVCHCPTRTAARSIRATPNGCSTGRFEQFAAFLEARVGTHGRGQQEPIALGDMLRRVLGLDVRMAAGHVVLGADATDGGHRLDHGGMLVLAWI